MLFFFMIYFSMQRSLIPLPLKEIDLSKLPEFTLSDEIEKTLKTLFQDLVSLQKISVTKLPNKIIYSTKLINFYITQYELDKLEPKIRKITPEAFEEYLKYHLLKFIVDETKEQNKLNSKQFNPFYYEFSKEKDHIFITIYDENYKEETENNTTIYDKMKNIFDN